MKEEEGGRDEGGGGEEIISLKGITLACVQVLYFLHLLSRILLIHTQCNISSCCYPISY